MKASYTAGSQRKDIIKKPYNHSYGFGEERIIALSSDAEHLLKMLPSTGRITNQTAVKKTGWDIQRVMTAKFELRDAGFVEIKKGWGGPFGKTSHLPIVPTTTSLQIQANAENELYEPLQKWITSEFVPVDFDSDKDLFEVTISANHRPSAAGTWEVPDIICLSLKKYPYVPFIQMELTTFEVKKASDALSPYGIFEAISHSKSAHYSYYCFEWLDDLLEIRAEYQRILQEASIHGIGLITFRFTDGKKSNVSVKELLEPQLLSPQPNAINVLIDSFFDESSKKKIIRRTGNL